MFGDGMQSLKVHRSQSLRKETGTRVLAQQNGRKMVEYLIKPRERLDIAEVGQFVPGWNTGHEYLSFLVGASRKIFVCTKA